MASLLTWHLLGLYPGKFALTRHSYSQSLTLPTVPSTTQILVLSPFTPKYTIHNGYLNVNTTVTVNGFDPNSVQHTIPVNASAYVKSVIINGNASASTCHFDFYDTFRLGGNITIELTADKASVENCGGSVPESISTGGFASAR